MSSSSRARRAACMTSDMLLVDTRLASSLGLSESSLRVKLDPRFLPFFAVFFSAARAAGGVAPAEEAGTGLSRRFSTATRCIAAGGGQVRHPDLPSYLPHTTQF